MSEPKSSPAFLPIVLGLFAASGCAALIYEIVWFELLELVIGSSAISLGILLAVYMGGLCLGSLLLPRLVSERAHPFRVYAVLELGIGALGVVILFGLPLVGRVYTAGVGHGLGGLALRGAVGAVCLLPPTILMGATLPAVSRWVTATPRGLVWLGYLYAGNTAGAVFGCLLAGFYLLRIHDTAVATFTAAAVNAAIAATALALSRIAPHRGVASSLREREEDEAMPTLGLSRARREISSDEREIASLHSQRLRRFASLPLLARNDEGVPTSRPFGTRIIYVIIGLSGLTALGAEVVWTRLLSLLLGGTVYTFSIILAVFLAGLAIGSALGSAASRRVASARTALGICQILLVAAAAWTALALVRWLPHWPIDPALSTSPWLNFQLDLARCIFAVFPATLLWGASFPLALTAAGSGAADPGRLVGGVYAANTVGAIAGAVGFSLVIIPMAGTQDAQRLLAGLSLSAGLLALGPALRTVRVGSRRSGSTAKVPRRRASLFRLSSVLIAAAAGCWLIGLIPKTPWELIAYGRNLPSKAGREKSLYAGEGASASVAVAEADKTRVFYISGRAEASNSTQDMRMERMLGHLPALLHGTPRSVLVVGCGAGVTAGAFVPHPGVRRIVICEIEPLVPRVVARYFARENQGVLDDPRVEVVIDDARHFMLATKEKFDVITSDPIHPWIKGSATLYTKEYFELCRRRLNPGGVAAQWVPLYQSDLRTVKSEFATFFEAFPYGTLWSNDLIGMGYDIVLIGQVEPARIDVDELAGRFESAAYRSLAESLAEVGFKTPTDLLATFLGRGSELTAWLTGAAINRDRNLRLQYLAGMGLNSGRGALIYNELLAEFKFPEGLFVGTAERLRTLRRALGVAK
jgi:spermidine synthase